MLTALLALTAVFVLAIVTAAAFWAGTRIGASQAETDQWFTLTRTSASTARVFDVTDAEVYIPPSSTPYLPSSATTVGAPPPPTEPTSAQITAKLRELRATATPEHLTTESHGFTTDQLVIAQTSDHGLTAGESLGEIIRIRQAAPEILVEWNIAEEPRYEWHHPAELADVNAAPIDDLIDATLTGQEDPRP